jgi:ubiquinone/menaquinone biosynthesis C-methylase UbiE
MLKHHPHDYIPAAGRDAFLPGYDLLTRLSGFHRVHDRMIRQAELADGHRVLEIGCGTGNLAIRAKKSRPGISVIGSDPDPLALKRAQRKAYGRSGICFEQGYAQRLPYADGEFDRVLSSMMLHHLDSDAKAAAAAEVFRVLRPGGRLHVVDMGGNMTPNDGLSARVVLHSPLAAGNLGDAILKLLRDTGFDCDGVDTHRQRFVGRLTYYRAARPA